MVRWIVYHVLWREFWPSSNTRRYSLSVARPKQRYSKVIGGVWTHHYLELYVHFLWENTICHQAKVCWLDNRHSHPQPIPKRFQHKDIPILPSRFVSILISEWPNSQTCHPVPMKFSWSTLLKMLLCTRNIMAWRQVGHNLFTSPSTIKNLGFRITGTPFQIWNKTSVSTFCPEIIWIGKVNLVVRPTWFAVSFRCPAALSKGLLTLNWSPPLPVASSGSPCAKPCCLFWIVAGSIRLPEVTAATKHEEKNMFEKCISS